MNPRPCASPICSPQTLALIGPKILRGFHNSEPHRGSSFSPCTFVRIDSVHISSHSKSYGSIRSEPRNLTIRFGSVETELHRTEPDLVGKPVRFFRSYLNLVWSYFHGFGTVAL